MCSNSCGQQQQLLWLSAGQLAPTLVCIGCGSHVIRTWHLWPHSKNATGHGNCAKTVSQFNPATSFRLYSYFI